MSYPYATQPLPPPPPGPMTPSNGLATAGFVLGLLGLLGSFIPLINIVGILLGLVGVVLAAVGLAKSKTSGVGKGLAVSGLVLGGLAMIIGVLVNIAFAIAVSETVDDVTVEIPERLIDDATTGDATTGDGRARDAVVDDAVAGTSRDNPVPLGTAISDGDWTVIINSVTTASESMYGQTPQAGSTLLVINMTVTYNGTDSQGESVWSTVKYITAEGAPFDLLDGSTLFIPEDQFDSLTPLYEGGSETGNRMLEVPADGWQKGVLAVSPAPFSEDTFVAVQ